MKSMYIQGIEIYQLQMFALIRQFRPAYLSLHVASHLVHCPLILRFLWYEPLITKL